MENKISNSPETQFGEVWFRSVIRPEHQDLPLQKALALRFTYHTEQEWAERICTGCVLLDNTLASPDLVVRRDQVVAYRVQNYREPQVPLDFHLAWENEEFLVVEKSAGTPVHHTGKIFLQTLTAEVRRRLREPEAAPLHRLDRDTSGLMLFARYKDTALRYQKHLSTILLRKIYLTAVPGEFFPQAFTCKTPLAEAGEGAPIPSKMCANTNGKSCQTGFRRLFHCANTGFSLVEAELHSGRKHQIRAHLEHLGFPVIGDALYSHEGFYYRKRVQEPLSDADIEVLGGEFQQLHAWRILLQPPGYSEPFWLESRRVDARFQKKITLAGDWQNLMQPTPALP